MQFRFKKKKQSEANCFELSVSTHLKYGFQLVFPGSSSPDFEG